MKNNEQMFFWTCPACGSHHKGSVNEDGPFLVVLCKSCNTWIDDGFLSAGDKIAVNTARDVVRVGLL